MTVWVASPTETVPTVRLGRWRVYAIGGSGTRHFAGYNLDKNTGRVSTAITEYDATTHRGHTASGRVYELVGSPAVEPDDDALYVWNAWCVLNRVSAFTDVTDEYAPNASSGES